MTTGKIVEPTCQLRLSDVAPAKRSVQQDPPKKSGTVKLPLAWHWSISAKAARISQLMGRTVVMTSAQALHTLVATDF